MNRLRWCLLLAGALLLGLALTISSCEGDDDDDDTGDDQGDDDVGANDGSGFDVGEDPDDDDDDDDDEPPPVTNQARADGFKLFYRERVNRVLTSFNRFSMTGDAGFATVIGKQPAARNGDRWEVVSGPNDNNRIGHSVYTAWHAYKNLGGRELELTLIRMFEGMAFLEAVTGHWGLTCREALPGWTVVLDGINGTVTRTRLGEPIDPPVVYPPELESEILDTFFSDAVITYRLNPEEFYFNFKPVHEMGPFAVTFVFCHLPKYLHISNCCSSWMITKTGLWAGAFWGNHNSRDNFPDLSFGYLAAMDALDEPGLPDDLMQAAERAAQAGHRVGNRILSDGNILMTVGERGDYDETIPAGQIRPDGRTEWQDLGSISSCTMAYLATALSTEGLDVPEPSIPLPGAIERELIRELFNILGVPNLLLPVPECNAIDDAYIGLGWGDIMDIRIGGRPWTEVAYEIAEQFPDLFPELFGSMMDDFNELEMAVVTLCYYGEVAHRPGVLEAARDTLQSLIDIHRVLADLVYIAAKSPNRKLESEVYEKMVKSTVENLYTAAVWARMYGIEAPDEHLYEFYFGNHANDVIANRLTISDTPYEPLKTDDQIMAVIQKELDGKVEKEPWIVDRYWMRFPDGPPVRRAGDGYEAIGPDGEWMPTENVHHKYFGGMKLFFEMPLCTSAAWTLSCDWASLGCERPDLNDSGAVDAQDRAIFDAAYAEYSGQSCNEANGWCGGADLDRSGAADADDAAFMDAANGCVR